MGGRAGKSGLNTQMPNIPNTPLMPPPDEEEELTEEEEEAVVEAVTPPTSDPADISDLSKFRETGRTGWGEMMQDDDNAGNINSRLAVGQYTRQDTDSAGYSPSQNLNHVMENGLPLTANQRGMYNGLMQGMHPLRFNTILHRAAHEDFLKAFGIQNYEYMTDQQLNNAIRGAVSADEKKFVSASVNRDRNPFMPGNISGGGREVEVKIYTPAGTPVILGDRAQTETILKPGVKYTGISAHFDGTYATPRNGPSKKRVIIEVMATYD